MHIIEIQPKESGSRPPIQTWSGATPPSGYAAVASGIDTSAMQTHAGFVNLTVEDGVVTAITGNDEAYQVWLASLPPPTPPEPTEQEDMAAMAIDHEYRLTLLELGVTNDAV